MPANPSPGPLLIVAGLALVVIGLLVWSGAFAWFGRLPGDVRVERPGFRFEAPIASMMVVSLAISAILGLWRWLNRP